MIFDTDVMIWAFRGNDKALDAIDRAVMRSISAVTYMELLKSSIVACMFSLQCAHLKCAYFTTCRRAAQEVV